MPVVIATSLGVYALSLPWIAETNTASPHCVGGAAFLRSDGRVAGCGWHEYHPRGRCWKSCISATSMVSFHALFSLGGVVGAALGGLLASRGITPRIHYWACGLGLLAMAMVAYRWLRLPAPVSEVAHSASRETLKWSITLGAIALLAFSFMLVEGAMVDWSAIYLRSTIRTGPGVAVLGYKAFFSAAMCAGRVAWRLAQCEIGARSPGALRRALLARGGVNGGAAVFGNAGGALLGFTFVGAGLATIVPNAFAAGGNIEGRRSRSKSCGRHYRRLSGVSCRPADDWFCGAVRKPSRRFLAAGDVKRSERADAAGAMNRTTPLVKSP